MNYPNLLARGLLILYSIFLLLFAFGEGVLKEGYIHAIPAIIILVLMVVFKHRPVLNFLIFLLMSVVSIWFFKTYSSLVDFLIISAPLGIASILFLLGKRRLG
jgi:membrane protein implicated in regulation of membrane protease activity